MGFVARWEKMETCQGPDLLWWFSKGPFPLFNGVTRVRLDEADADAVIASLLDRARARAVPFMAWLGPSTCPADTGARLTRNGFGGGGPEPGMVLDLRALGPEPLVPYGVYIERVDDGAAVRRYCRACVEGFEFPGFVQDPFVEFFLTAGITHDGPLQHFVAGPDGTPVATSTLFLAAGVAGVYNVITAPSARRRGLGRALTYRALTEARQAGYRFAILHASPAGAPLHRLMGFREVCKVTTHVWTPDGPA
jgi:GNAT superfamily N-acetyltransferase